MYKGCKYNKIETIEQQTYILFIFARIYLSGHSVKAYELSEYMQCDRMETSRGAALWKQYCVKERLRKT